jgi:peroxiredoxin
MAAATLLLLACGDARNGEQAMPAPAVQSAARAATRTPEVAKVAAKPTRAERPLPAFGGYTLGDERLEISSLIGKRLLLYFFNPEVKDSAVVTQAIESISALRGKHNFEIVGVAIGSTRKTAKEFAERHHIDFPVIDDSNARIARRLGLRTPLAILGVDAEGYVIFGFVQFVTQGEHATAQIESQLRQALRLPEEGGAHGGPRPEAPLFSARQLDADEPFDLKDQRGKGVVLVFFLHTCPHCHELLTFLKTQLEALPEEHRPLLVGLEVTGKTFAVRSELERLGLDYFPVIFDDDGKIAADYGVFGGVPDTFLIDASGRIAWRMQGWQPKTDEPLLRMRLASIGGGKVPMLLAAEGYSGNEVCGVCHVAEHDTWLITRHASAYDTLVEHGSDADGECVGCHVVGFGKPGGFEISPRVAALENVGCESCHGRGGPHLSPGFVADGDYSTACVTCHDAKHSLGFEYATFVPRISHAANAKILALPAAERDRILEERGAARKQVLPGSAAHVGSDACQECHPAEYKTWLKSGHAHAVASLVKPGKQEDAACLKCHTTGFGRDGGFPSTGTPDAYPDLARVGCESCHGPGGDHVAEGSTKLGSILSLGDKCDSCVILQICGSCHDEANDPGFEFEVVDKIDAIRHGTIEAGTGRKLAPGEKSGQKSAADGHGETDFDPVASAAVQHVLNLEGAARR